MSKIVTIVGVGALGSHLVQFLRSEDVAINVIDFDRVEMRNTQSQFHSKPSVGKMKSNALKQSMQFLYGRKIGAKTNKLVASNVDVLLQGDLIIDCVDNGATRRLSQDHVRAKGLPCLHGALAADGSFGRVIWDDGFTIDDESGEGGATCENGEFLPFIGITACYLARATQIFLTEGKRIGFSISPAGAVRV